MKNSEVEITEKDVMGLMDILTSIPVIMLKGAIKGNMNAVKTFKNQIKSYKTRLTPEELDKIKAVLKMPVSEIQAILSSVYKKTGKKQLKILADPESHKFISLNLKELERVLFG